MRFSLNIPNGLGEKIVNEAESTGRNKQRMICHMAEMYFDAKKGITDSRLLFLCILLAFVTGGLGLLVVWLSMV